MDRCHGLISPPRATIRRDRYQPTFTQLGHATTSVPHRRCRFARSYRHRRASWACRSVQKHRTDQEYGPSAKQAHSSDRTQRPFELATTADRSGTRRRIPIGHHSRPAVSCNRVSATPPDKSAFASTSAIGIAETSELCDALRRIEAGTGPRACRPNHRRSRGSLDPGRPPGGHRQLPKLPRKIRVRG